MGQPSEPPSDAPARSRARTGLREQVSFWGSVAAVAISVVTFYYTQIRHTEVLSIKTAPLLYMAPAGKGAGISFRNMPEYVVFANSGNRPVAVTDLYLTLFLSKQPTDDCTIVPDGRIRMTYRIGQPLIVRSADVTASLNTLDADGSVAAPDESLKLSLDKDKNFVVRPKDPFPNDFYVRACLSAFVVTSGDSRYQSHLLSAEHVTIKGSQVVAERVSERGAAYQPEPIYAHTALGLF